MKKKPMPKGNANSSNKCPATPAPSSKTKMPAGGGQMPKSTKVSRGKAGALY